MQPVIIVGVDRAVRTGERRGYGAAVEGLLEPLGGTLIRLERVAEAPPEEIVAEAREELPALQYTLHASAELALGLDPPARVGPLHAELVDALAQARDATAEIVGAVDEGDDDLITRLLPEWRGALFRVRLARLRALERSPLRLPAEEPVSATRSRGEVTITPTTLVATVLVIAGALLFTAGAVLAAWPLWAAGLALFGGGFVLLRP
jgi:hypothetical protein